MTVKLCKDCKYSKFPNDIYPRRADIRCTHPSNLTIDLVDGSTKYVRSTCDVMRAQDIYAPCGTTGKLFEKKDK